MIADPNETVNLADISLDEMMPWRDQAARWEKTWGFPDNLKDGTLRELPVEPVDIDEIERGKVLCNEGSWPESLPDEERDTVETYEEAFVQALREDASLFSAKLPIDDYERKSGRKIPPINTAT